MKIYITLIIAQEFLYVLFVNMNCENVNVVSIPFKYNNLYLGLQVL